MGCSDIPYSSANLRIAHRMVVSRSRQTPPTPLLHAFSDATTRQLPADERRAIEKYVAELSHAQQVPASGATSACRSGAERTE